MGFAAGSSGADHQDERGSDARLIEGDGGAVFAQCGR